MRAFGDEPATKFAAAFIEARAPADCRIETGIADGRQIAGKPPEVRLFARNLQRRLAFRRFRVRSV